MSQTLVLTGGPSGGKTTLAMAIVRAFGEQVIMVPESASLLFSGGFRRVTDPEGTRDQQRAIYQVQVSHEAIFHREYPKRLLVCDRGTLDGLAYWPEGEMDFFTAVRATKAKEFERYTWVIHLDTASAANYNTATNIHRVETPATANHINEKVHHAWDGHPQRFVIPSTKTFLAKMSMTLSVVERILSGCTYTEVCRDVPGF